MRRAQRHARGAVLVFGESRNDSDSIAELVIAANPSLRGRVRPLPRPTSLTRTAGALAVRRWVDDIATAIRGHQAVQGPVTAVLVHRDADGPDPGETVAAALQCQLASLGGHPVVPVQAMEAWWFLFPDAVEAVRPGVWRNCMPRRRRDVETIDQPKHELIRRTGARKGAPYAEADSPAIARKVREQAQEPLGTSVSYRRLTELAVILS
jgi:hypothetical protein